MIKYFKDYSSNSILLGNNIVDIYKEESPSQISNLILKSNLKYYDVNKVLHFILDITKKNPIDYITISYLYFIQDQLDNSLKSLASVSSNNSHLITEYFTSNYSLLFQYRGMYQ